MLSIWNYKKITVGYSFLKACKMFLFLKIVSHLYIGYLKYIK